MDAKLIIELKKIVGKNKVSTRMADLVSYAHDYWPLFLIKFLRGDVPNLPDVVVFPDSIEDVVKTLKFAYNHDVPVYAYGGGTGVIGSAIPEAGGIVLDLKGLNWIRIDKDNLFVDVGAGVIGKVLEDRLNYEGFTLGHFPQSFYASTVGGWINTKATGQFSTLYGGIEDMVLGLEVVLSDGTLLRHPPYPRAAIGPDVYRVFIGSEGGLGVITRAYLRIWPRPKRRALLSFGSSSLEDALTSVKNILWRGVKPAVIRVYDEVESKKWFYMVSGRGWNIGTIIILEGDPQLVEAQEKIVREEFSSAKFLGDKPVKYWLEKRFDVREVSDFVPLGIVVDTIEVAVNWSNATKLYSEVIKAIRSVPGTLVAYAHASHFYPQGLCFYFIFGGAPEETLPEEYYWSVWSRVMEATMRFGGAISHHHGIGRLRGTWLRQALGEGYLDLIMRIKSAFDKKSLLNKGLYEHYGGSKQ